MEINLGGYGITISQYHDSYDVEFWKRGKTRQYLAELNVETKVLEYSGVYHEEVSNFAITEDKENYNFLKERILSVIENNLEHISNSFNSGNGYYYNSMLHTLEKDYTDQLQVYTDVKETCEKIKQGLLTGYDLTYQTKLAKQELKELKGLKRNLYCEYLLLYAKMVVTIYSMKETARKLSMMYSPTTTFLIASLDSASYFGFEPHNSDYHVSSTILKMPEKGINKSIERGLQDIYRLTRKKAIGYAVVTGEQVEQLPITGDSLIEYFTL